MRFGRKGWVPGGMGGIVVLGLLSTDANRFFWAQTGIIALFCIVTYGMVCWYKKCQRKSRMISSNRKKSNGM